MIAERILLSYKKYIDLTILRPATVCGYSPSMRLDVAVNALTYGGLKDNKITVFGGKQIRPNLNIKDMVNSYSYFLKKKIKKNKPNRKIIYKLALKICQFLVWQKKYQKF